MSFPRRFSAFFCLLVTVLVVAISGCGAKLASTASSTTIVTTATTLTASSYATASGASVTLMAAVSPATATGTVEFYDTTTLAVLGSSTLSSGTATLSVSFTSAGTHKVEAIYAGDSSDASSASATISIVVNAALTPTTTTLVSSSYSVASGTSFTLTATVNVTSTGNAATSATGSVQFVDTTTSTAMGSATPASGVATLTASLSAAGTHSIEAIFAGDSNYAASTSAAISVNITSSSSGGSSAAIALSVSPSSTTVGSGVGLAAVVTPVGTTGTVTFYDQSTSTTLGTASLSAQSVAALTVTNLAVGSHGIYATYSSSQSNTQTVTISSATLGSFANGAACGYTAGGATGAYVLSSGTLAASAGSYSTSTSDQNAICVTGAKAYLTLLSPTIFSSAASTVDGDSSFYGLDAAVLDYNGGNLTIDGGTVTTTGEGGNMVYAYGTGTVTISNAALSSTSPGNGHGIYASGAGTIVANNVTANSTGSASSIVATDRGGGTVTINGGSYTAQGGKSAGIYSTGTVTANNASFTSTSAEAAVIEGDNSIVLNNATLTSASSGTHRGIFLYQSMSGDANNTSLSCQGTATGDCLVMNGGTFNYTDTTAGNTDPASNCTAFEVYNQTSLILLTDAAINNNCPTLLLSGYNDQWSNASAYGYATLKAYGMTLNGNVIVGDTCLTTACTSRDTSSTAALYLYQDTSGTATTLTGAINNSDTGAAVSLTMDAVSKWEVTGTSYLTALTDADGTYANITCQTAGCKVYVGTTEIK